MPTLRMAPMLTSHAESDAFEKLTKTTIQMKASSMRSDGTTPSSLPVSRLMVLGKTSASEAIQRGKFTQ